MSQEQKVSFVGLLEYPDISQEVLPMLLASYRNVGVPINAMPLADWKIVRTDGFLDLRRASLVSKPAQAMSNEDQGPIALPRIADIC